MEDFVDYQFIRCYVEAIRRHNSLFRRNGSQNDIEEEKQRRTVHGHHRLNILQISCFTSESEQKLTAHL